MWLCLCNVHTLDSFHSRFVVFSFFCFSNDWSPFFLSVYETINYSIFGEIRLNVVILIFHFFTTGRQTSSLLCFRLSLSLSLSSWYWGLLQRIQHWINGLPRTHWIVTGSEQQKISKWNAISKWDFWHRSRLKC